MSLETKADKNICIFLLNLWEYLCLVGIVGELRKYAKEKPFFLFGYCLLSNNKVSKNNMLGSNSAFRYRKTYMSSFFLIKKKKLKIK